MTTKLYGKVRAHITRLHSAYPNLNMTELAEDTAIVFNHDEWLDDPDHWIWDLALIGFDEATNQ